ncbi:hypothetical protein HYW31_00065 [Candidatus Berkelbacteria bacterium]|nr:hypothetical protein [Candidatus Berkelbacteria bacterium]
MRTLEKITLGLILIVAVGFVFVVQGIGYIIGAVIGKIEERPGQWQMEKKSRNS